MLSPCARTPVQILTGLAGVAALALTSSPANAIDVFDNRKASENGFDIIYEARDLDLPQVIMHLHNVHAAEALQ